MARTVLLVAPVTVLPLFWRHHLMANIAGVLETERVVGHRWEHEVFLVERMRHWFRRSLPEGRSWRVGPRVRPSRDRVQVTSLSEVIAGNDVLARHVIRR